MLAWLTQNLSTIVVLVVLAGIVAAIIVHMIRNKKKGKSSCSCGCESCGLCDACNGGKK